MIKYLISGLLATLIGFVLYVLIHLGVWKEVDIKITTEESLILLGKENIGAYHKILPAILEVEKWAKSQQLPCLKTFGHFLDDPEKVDEVRLRSFVGCVVPYEVDQIPPEFQIVVREKQKYVKALFSGSPSISPYKVYPKAMKVIHENRLGFLGDVVEIYTIKADQTFETTYLFPVQE
jgi:AraC family transcriptional regulator